MAISQSRRGKKNYLLITFVVLLVVLIVVAGIALFTVLRRPVASIVVEEAPRFIAIGNATLVRMSMPAVNPEGEGVLTELIVEAAPGTGRILVDIENLLFWADTQHSMRIARLVAANITGLNLSDYDLVYNIFANASIIGGPSAGAAITISTIAALQNKSLNASVQITGGINHDGSIFPVSEILAKAQAAKNANATLFLVPLLQSRDVIYRTEKHCEKFGWTEICTIEQIPEKVYVGEKAGIEVREVGSVAEALDYFIE